MKYLVFVLLLTGCASQSDLVKLLVEETNGYKQAWAQATNGLNQCKTAYQEVVLKNEQEMLKKKPLEKKAEKKAEEKK